MVSRKPLRAPTIGKEFLDGAPIEAVEPKPKRAAKSKPAAEAPAQLDLVLTDVEVEPTKLVSMKIPLKLFEDIDTLRRNSRLTLTDIFVKSAEPQVARLLTELRQRQQ